MLPRVYIKSTIRVPFDIIRSGAEVQSSHYFPGPARPTRAGAGHRHYLSAQWLAKLLLVKGWKREKERKKKREKETEVERGSSGVDAEFKQVHFLSLVHIGWDFLLVRWVLRLGDDSLSREDADNGPTLLPPRRNNPVCPATSHWQVYHFALMYRRTSLSLGALSEVRRRFSGNCRGNVKHIKDY